MAVTAKAYGPFIFGQFGGTDERRIDWANDTIKVVLLKGSYVFDQDGDGFLSDVQADEVVATNYTAGGKELFEKSVSYDAATNTTALEVGKDTEWKEVSLEAFFAVIYKDTGSATTSPLIGCVDFGEGVKAASGLFKIEWDADGVLEGIVA